MLSRSLALHGVTRAVLDDTLLCIKLERRGHLWSVRYNRRWGRSLDNEGFEVRRTRAPKAMFLVALRCKKSLPISLPPFMLNTSILMHRVMRMIST